MWALSFFLAENAAELRQVLLCTRCVTAGRAARDDGIVHLRVEMSHRCICVLLHAHGARMTWAADLASFEATMRACGRMAGWTRVRWT